MMFDIDSPAIEKHKDVKLRLHRSFEDLDTIKNRDTSALEISQAKDQLIEFSKSSRDATKKDFPRLNDTNNEIKHIVIELKNGYFYWNNTEIFRDDANYLDKNSILQQRLRAKTSDTMQKIKQRNRATFKQNSILKNNDIFSPKRCKRNLEEP